MFTRTFFVKHKLFLQKRHLVLVLSKLLIQFLKLNDRHFNSTRLIAIQGLSIMFGRNILLHTNLMMHLLILIESPLLFILIRISIFSSQLEPISILINPIVKSFGIIPISNHASIGLLKRLHRLIVVCF